MLLPPPREEEGRPEGEAEAGKPAMAVGLGIWMGTVPLQAARVHRASVGSAWSAAAARSASSSDSMHLGDLQGEGA